MKKNLLLSFMLVASSMFAVAQTTAFTAGNVVVVRVGNGSGVTTTFAPVNLLEYTPQGALVQTISLGSTGTDKLVLNLNNAQEGGLNLSTDGNFLSLVGYDANFSEAAIAPALSPPVGSFDKVIARIPSDASVNYTTKILKTEVTNIRQTTSIDGSAFWFASSQNGVRYVPFGNLTTTPSVSIFGSPTNIKSLNIFNGRLYAGGFNSTFGIGTVGTGIPTTTTTLSAALPGLPTGGSANANGIYFFDLDNNNTPDVLYTIDGVNLRKYSFSTTNVDYVNNISTAAAAGTYGVYSAAPTLTISGGGGTGATASVFFNAQTGKVTSWYISNRGTGYTSAPTVTVNGTLTSGSAIAAPTVTIASAPAWVLNSTTNIALSTVTGSTITSAGTGYSPTISITGDGTGATATSTITNGIITGLNITNGGSGYTVPPIITFTSATGAGAIATATLTGDAVTGATIANGGTGYGATVAIAGGGGSGATATATTVNGIVTAITITNAGFGYSTAPTFTIGGEGSGATATSTITASGNAFGITGIKNGSNVELFITSGNGQTNHNLQRITDAAGFNAPASITATTLAFSGTNNVFRGVAFTPGTTTLPVSLTSFTGKKTSNGNQLNWATASEINNQRFDILRSTDKDNFQVISSVNGKNKPSQYNYLDVSPAAGFNYYKLNQVDFDGTVTPSTKIVAINSDLSDKESTITVSNGILTYSINSNDAATSTLQIFDTNGRKVLAKDLSLTTGLTQGTLSVESLNTGVYVARLMVNGKAVTTKFVK